MTKYSADEERGRDRKSGETSATRLCNIGASGLRQMQASPAARRRCVGDE